MCVAMMRPIASLSVWRRCTRILAITIESTPTMQCNEGKGSNIEGSDSDSKSIERQSKERGVEGKKEKRER